MSKHDAHWGVKLVTASQRYCGKVMFSVMLVILSMARNRSPLPRTPAPFCTGPRPWRLYRALALPPPDMCGTNLFNLDLTVQVPGPIPPMDVFKLVQLGRCWHVRLASGQLASYWNVFLFSQIHFVSFTCWKIWSYKTYDSNLQIT